MKEVLNILLLEDNQKDAELVCATLEGAGFECRFEVVESGPDFVSALERGDIDLILSDYSLPEFDGLSALKISQEKSPDAPFIFVTGTMGEERAVEALKSGATDYVLKDKLYRLVPAIGRAFKEVEERTERKRAEKALRKSEERFRKLVESVTSYIYIVDVKDGKPASTKHGAGCGAVTGYTSEEYEADPNLWYMMIHEGDRAAVIEQVNKVLSGKAVRSLEHRIIHKDGTTRWMRNTPVPRYDEHGRVAAYDGLIADITESRKLEEQLRHAQKMEAIGTLAGGIAHDFNNMLNVIIGYASLMQMHMSNDDPRMEQVKEILNAGDRAAHLTRGLLTFSRKQVMEIRTVDINEIISSFKKMLASIIGEDIEFRIIPSEQTLTVKADIVQIDQVLLNLASNARDAMPKGGLLTIETRPFEMDSEFINKHGFGEPGMYAFIAVTDTGAGMDDETRERIFEPFFTTKELGRGTGLGLSIVYGIIKQHNGYIACQSEPGKGTVFNIYIPMIGPEAEKTEMEEEILPKGGTETVLVAEDDADVRGMIKQAFEEFGYKIIEAVDGEDAVIKFRENKERIDLLLLDLIMPKKNGKDAYEDIKGIRHDIKVIFVSGYAADIMQKFGIEEGIEFISKPVSPTELLRKVRYILG